MAAFPNLKRQENEDREPDNGLRIVLAPDGNQFGQSLYGAVWYEFRPIFVNMTEAEAFNLEAFEEANRLLAFDYSYVARNRSTLVYSCRFFNPGVRVVWSQEQIWAQAFFRGQLTQVIPAT